MDAEELLRSTGMNRYEAAVYSALVRNGTMTAKELSRNAGVPMGKIYEVLAALKDQSFLEVQNARPALYHPVKPRVAFRKFMERRRLEAEAELGRLEETISAIEAVFPPRAGPGRTDRMFISTVMGPEEVINSYRDAIAEAERRIKVISSVRMKDPSRTAFHETVEFITDLMIDGAERGVTVKCIDPGTGLDAMLNRKIEAIDDAALRRTVAAKIKIKMIETDYDFVLIDTSTTIVDVPDPIEGLIMAVLKIVDTEFNQRLAARFDALWRGAVE